MRRDKISSSVNNLLPPVPPPSTRLRIFFNFVVPPLLLPPIFILLVSTKRIGNITYPISVPKSKIAIDCFENNETPPPPPPPPPQQTKTRILVLLNMVSDEDLKTDEEYSGLIEEVEEEVRKFGKLLSMQIPRKSTLTIEASAFGKIFLEYATTQDSANAEQELAGRQFGPNVVEASYYNEQEYASLKLR
mmetsp:Transcript_24987/g.28593  ORF Transcript_24987/g.28593 Transcript_24987/m.28593 type:complete len:190 (+) Transcript_24987:1150-1719(+)